MIWRGAEGVKKSQLRLPSLAANEQGRAAIVSIPPLVLPGSRFGSEAAGVIPQSGPVVYALQPLHFAGRARHFAARCRCWYRLKCGAGPGVEARYGVFTGPQTLDGRFGCDGRMPGAGAGGSRRIGGHRYFARGSKIRTPADLFCLDQPARDAPRGWTPMHPAGEGSRYRDGNHTANEEPRICIHGQRSPTRNRSQRRSGGP